MRISGTIVCRIYTVWKTIRVTQEIEILFASFPFSQFGEDEEHGSIGNFLNFALDRPLFS